MSFLISVPFRVLGLTTVAFLAACSPEPKSPNAAVEPASAVAAAEPAALPQIDMENARQFAGDGQVTPLMFARDGSTTVSGAVKGDKAPVYAAPVAAGQTLVVTFQSDSDNLYINISEATDHSGAAVHRGEFDGRTASLKAERDTTYILAPFQPRASARRNETGDFTLTVTRRQEQTSGSRK